MASVEAEDKALAISQTMEVNPIAHAAFPQECFMLSASFSVCMTAPHADPCKG